MVNTSAFVYVLEVQKCRKTTCFWYIQHHMTVANLWSPVQAAPAGCGFHVFLQVELQTWIQGGEESYWCHLSHLRLRKHHLLMSADSQIQKKTESSTIRIISPARSTPPCKTCCWCSLGVAQGSKHQVYIGYKDSLNISRLWDPHVLPTECSCGTLKFPIKFRQLNWGHLLPSRSWSCRWIPASQCEVTLGPTRETSWDGPTVGSNGPTVGSNGPTVGSNGPTVGSKISVPSLSCKGSVEYPATLKPFRSNPSGCFFLRDIHIRKNWKTRGGCPPASSTWKNPWMSWILQGLEVFLSQLQKGKHFSNFASRPMIFLYCFYLKQIFVWNSENCFLVLHDVFPCTK